jgi:hypothetical protein
VNREPPRWLVPPGNPLAALLKSAFSLERDLPGELHCALAHFEFRNPYSNEGMGRSSSLGWNPNLHVRDRMS